MIAGLLLCAGAAPRFAAAAEPSQGVAVSPRPGDVFATGNTWIALPEIRADDGALVSFNVLSMRYRGLLQVEGDGGAPVLQPTFEVEGKPVAFRNPSWKLIAYWIPTARLDVDGVEMTLTWCAPPGARAAFLRMTMTNHRSTAVSVAPGVKASWGALDRVTYLPVALHGQLTDAPAPWVDSGEVFSYVTDDTQFSWSVLYPGSEARVDGPPESHSPEVTAQHAEMLAPGQTTEAVFLLGAGPEEFSAGHNARALEEEIDRDGAEAVIDRAAQWCLARTRTTGQPDLDMLMNRNFLFTAMYAWGRTIDTEQFVGVTSRSPRYYVSAAYWDRDAMLWSFPGLLDIDRGLAKEALEYALTTQLRNAGTHSRFIDGVVLEDGFELDEAAAPLVALSAYVDKTGDDAFLRAHRDGVEFLLKRIESHRDAATGLYSTLQDAQDEYEKPPFITYDNVLVWKTFLDAKGLLERLQDTAGAARLTQQAAELRTAILQYCVAGGAPGAAGTIFVSATDGSHPTFADVPPGSLMNLPLLGFVPQTDPVFERTWDWLHSSGYRHAYADRPYGVPGSYRLPFTPSWSVADELQLTRGREQALKILRGSPWDNGIITEGVSPDTAAAEPAGRAFATAAGYVANAICQTFCRDAPK
ncbi:MAG TPA: glycoside hydrolase family 125 protein [Acidobacteriaceae bacterium]|nr:glycoside hydrolase family 125 protein [Acidobacteriaceae bacterium]